MQPGNFTTHPAPSILKKRAMQALRFRSILFIITMVMATSAHTDIAIGPNPLKDPNTRPFAPQYKIEDDGSVELRICFNSSCARTEMVKFSAEEMEKVKGQLAFCQGQFLYDRLQRVRIAVWQMEVLSEKHIPLLANDREVNDREFGVNGRLDCVDNASNTTTFLKILKDLGELPSWRIDKPGVRKPLNFNSVHWAAVVTDENTGDQWAVDSWFRPNGHLPIVLPLKDWKEETQGWLPPFNTLNPNPRASNEFCRK